MIATVIGVLAGVAVVLVAAARIQRGARRRIAARSWIRELEDGDAGLVTWRAVVDLLPDSIRREFSGGLTPAQEWRGPAPIPSGAYMRYALPPFARERAARASSWTPRAQEEIRSPYAP